MNAKPPTELLNAALTGFIDYGLLKHFAATSSKSVPDVLDQLARYVAEQYLGHNMSFADADAIMNAAFAVSVSEVFWTKHNCTIPDIMYKIYLAFDAGEYYHSGDERDVNPEAKYTRPLIECFLLESQSDT
jgi:hypothetical protein